MIRARFKAKYGDWRPIKWPPPGPCWCTGYASDESASIVVAYVENEAQIKEFWPEATHVETESDKDIEFSSRFPRPDWWLGKGT